MSEYEFKKAPTAEAVEAFRAALAKQVMERFGVDEDGDPRVFMSELRALTLHEPHRYEMIPHEHKADTLEEKTEILRRVIYNAKVANDRLFRALDGVTRGLSQVHEGQRVADRGEEIKQAVRSLVMDAKDVESAPESLRRRIKHVGRVVLGREVRE